MGALVVTKPLEKFGSLSSQKETKLPTFHKLLETRWKDLNRTSKSEEVTEEISPLQLELLALLGTYKDVYYPEASPLNKGPQVRSTYCIHILNHVLKANSQVLAHNAQLRAQKNNAEDEPRDQGLTRPKVKYRWTHLLLKAPGLLFRNVLNNVNKGHCCLR